MRRLIAISMLLVAASAVAACTSSPTSTPNSGHASGSNQGSDSAANASACAQLRTVVTSDLGPIGTAFGTIVGDATAKNSAGLTTADSEATTALQKLSSDLEAAVVSGDAPAVKSAVATTKQNLTTLASDPSFLSGITTMDGIAAATAKLQTATAPITTICQGP